MSGLNRRAALLPGLLIAGALGVSGTALGADEAYDCTLNATSILNFNLNTTAPLSGTFRGNEAATPATRTKTPPQNFFACGIVAGENDPVPFSGTGTVTGSGTNLHPTGTFRLGFDPVAGTAYAQSASLSLLGSSTATATSLIDNFGASAFCATNPSCQVPLSLTFDLPIGDAQITSVLAAQTGGATGTLTPNGPDSWTFNIPATFDVTPTVIFQGAPLDAGTQTVPAVLTGTVTRAGAGVVVSATIAINVDQSDATPVPLPETPFSLAGLPICNGLNILLTATINSTHIVFGSTATLAADGVRVACPCDFGGNGTVGVDDLFAYLDAWFVQFGTSGANLSADFDDSGDVSVADLFAFLDCWFAAFGGTCAP